jgi:hypothetical protein
MFITVHTDREHKEFVAINVNQIVRISSGTARIVGGVDIPITNIQLVTSKELVAYESYEDVMRMINEAFQITHMHIN